MQNSHNDANLCAPARLPSQGGQFQDEGFQGNHRRLPARTLAND